MAMRRGHIAVLGAILTAGLGLSGCSSGASALGLSGQLGLTGVVAAVAAPIGGFDEDPPAVDEDADTDPVTGEEVDLAPAPQNVKALLPELGPVSGGTVVTITGSDFHGKVIIEFDGVRATEVDVMSKTKVTAFTPAAKEPGPVDVVIENGDGAISLLEGGFTYVAAAAAPQIVESSGGNGVAIITVAKPHVSEAVENYQYSLDDGLTWTGFNPAQVLSPVTITKLTNGQAYTIRLRAISVAGFGASSEAVTVTPTAPGPSATVPGAPTINQAATKTGWNAEIGTWIQLSFTPPSPPANSGPMYSECSSSTSGWAPCNSGWLMKGLQAATTYELRVRAVNDAGPGATASISVATKARVKAPTTAPVITEVRAGKGLVNVVVTKPVGATGYEVKYSAYIPSQKKWGPWTSFTKARLTTHGYVYVAPLQSKVKYSFVVRGVNSAGAGPQSKASTGAIVQ